MVIALVVTPQGFPLAYEVMPGNTSDKTTLKDFLQQIEAQYGRSDRVWIMDRGIPNDIAGRHPAAKTITLVMDNLNTHRPGALYEAFPPAEAKALWDRFEFIYTPKHGSWLNVAEVELSVMIRQCLNRRIASIKVLRDEVAAWQASRDRIQAKVNWQFTTDDARVNLKRLYPTFDE